MSLQRRSAQPTLQGVKVGTVSLTPSGLPQLDPLLGGGLALGSTFLLAEDRHAVYSRLMVKAFIAEGIVHDHKILLIDGEWPIHLDELPRKILKDRSSGSTQDNERLQRHKESSGPGDPMKIAFRYERLPQHESLPEVSTDHVLDFGLTIEPEILAKAAIVRCQALTETSASILATIAANISSTNVLRVVATAGILLDAGFLRKLKILARHENVICLVSVPECVEIDRYHRLFAIADIVISLLAFSSEERKTNPLYKKFHGLLSLDKLPEMNSITGPKPLSVEYTFHQCGKRFTLEQLHLPPELTVETGPPKMSCPTTGGGNNRTLDF